MGLTAITKAKLRLDEPKSARKLYRRRMPAGIRKTTADFIRDAIGVHGDKYDYSLTVYENQSKPVKIRCKTCGLVFQKQPKLHLRGKGSGCRNCLVKQGFVGRLTQEQFVARATEAHAGKFDYTESRYIDIGTKVAIRCLDCGLEFWQSPRDHIHSLHGCPDCNGGRALTKQQFLDMAKVKYEDRYDLSEVVYSAAKIPVKIGCTIHGWFWKMPDKFIREMQGCTKCSLAENITAENFLEKARAVHGDRYGYSKAKLSKSTDRVCITCTKHGDFWQTPSAHINGSGCKLCSCQTSGPEKEWLDFLGISLECRQVAVKVDDRWFKFDGYHKESGIALEFLGDFWHGNPNVHQPDSINPLVKEPYGKLYEKILEKLEFLERHNIDVAYIWEYDWKKFKKEHNNGSQAN